MTTTPLNRLLAVKAFVITCFFTLTCGLAFAQDNSSSQHSHMARGDSANIEKMLKALESRVSAAVARSAHAPLEVVRLHAVTPVAARVTARPAAFTAQVASFPSVTSYAQMPTAPARPSQLIVSNTQAGSNLNALAQQVAQRYRIETAVAQVIVDTAHTVAQEKGLPLKLILGVIARESSFNHEAVNHKDLGLMQVNLKWHADKIDAVGGAPAMFDPVTNIQVGADVLVEYMKASKGDVLNALRRYNGLGKDNDYPQEVVALMRSF